MAAEDVSMLRLLRTNPRARRNPVLQFTSSTANGRGGAQGTGLSELILQAIYPQVNRVLPSEILAPSWRDPVRLAFTRKDESINVSGVAVRPLGEVYVLLNQQGDDVSIDVMRTSRGTEIFTPFDTAAVHRWARTGGAEAREALRYWFGGYSWESFLREDGYYSDTMLDNRLYGDTLAHLKPEQISRSSTAGGSADVRVSLTDEQLNDMLRRAAEWGGQVPERVLQPVQKNLDSVRRRLDNIQDMVSRPWA